MELTKLQRIGISHLMLEMRKRNPKLINGRLQFHNNRKGEFTNMYITEYKPFGVWDDDLRLMITLQNENIDDTLQYEYKFDPFYEIYHITIYEERNKNDGVC